MSFLIGILNGIRSALKLSKKALFGYKIKGKDIGKVFRNALIPFLVCALIVIAIIGGAIYSVTDAIGDMFNGIQKLYGSSESPSSSFYQGLSEEQIQELIDETGASFNPSKVAGYLKKQEESVPSSISGKRIKIHGDSSALFGDSQSSEEVNIDTSDYANKFKTNWEFIAAVDIAGFTGDDSDNTTAIDNAASLFPQFTWMDDVYRTTTDTSRSWNETYEYDPTTGETKKVEDTYDKSAEIYDTVKEPLAIPSKVDTMFGDYNYSVNRDVTLADNDYCEPYIESQEVSYQQRYNGKKPDYNQPIYVDKNTNMVQGVNSGQAYVLRDWKNSSLSSDTDITYDYVGEEDDFYKYSYSYFFGLLHKYIYIYKDDIPEGEVNQSIKYIGVSTEKVFSGDYVMVDDYKTITITKNHMKKTKQKVTEDQVSTITQNFNPSKFIQYLNSCNLNVDDLELVIETMKNIPNGNYLLDNLQRIVDGDYGDIGQITTNAGNINLDGLIPLFLQADERWGSQPYSGSTIARAGCGVTSMAMVVTGLGGDINSVRQYDVDGNGFLDPGEVARYATANGHSTNGEGTMRSLYGDLGAKMGLKVTNTGNPSEVYSALQQGKVVISSMTPGHFTHASHLMVLTGLAADGTVTVNDPASEERSHQTWDFNIIKAEADDYWICENPNVVTETFTITSYFGATYGDGLSSSEVSMEGNGQLITSTGVDLTGKDLRDKICAVDPSVIPYHSKLFISFSSDFNSVTLPDGTACNLNGYYSAEDTGGAFQGGKKKIDLYAGAYGKSPKYRDIANMIGTRDETVRYRKKA